RGELDARLRGLRSKLGRWRNQDRFGTRRPSLQSAGRSHDAAAEIDRARAVGGIGLKEGATAEGWRCVVALTRRRNFRRLIGHDDIVVLGGGGGGLWRWRSFRLRPRRAP